MEIQLQNLTKKFPNRNRKHPGDVIAVNEFNFTIPDGQLIGLLGPSGCGKSTTLNLICGLEKPTSGKIFFGGEDVTGVEPEHRSVGMVFQNYALYPHLTVRKNIMFPLENLKGKARAGRSEDGFAGRTAGSKAKGAFRRSAAACSHRACTGKNASRAFTG